MPLPVPENFAIVHMSQTKKTYAKSGLSVSMGERLPLSENLSFAKQIKSLADDELLDIWEETQRLEHIMLAEWDAAFELAPEYERLIVLELQYRTGMRGTERHAAG